MARGYFTTQISEGREETPEGFLIVPDCVIARTGFQSYAVKDLPQETAQDLGVDVSVPHANIDVYRRPEDVFSADTLRSFEGKPITEGHPEDFVDPKNFNEHCQGHVQNVRKGPEPLESGDWPMIADLHFTAEPLLSKVRANMLQELSCGYDFGIERDGNKICQTDITGNHVAVVPKGRAGPEARINDALPNEIEAQPAKVELGDTVTSAKEAAKPSYPPIVIPPIPTKEKHPVAKNKWLRSLMGKHLIEKARAADADPEEIMDMAEELGQDEVEVPKNTGANEFKSEDKKGKDGEVPEALKEHQFKSEDKKGKDVEMDDKRKAAHDALDALLDRTAGTETGVPAKDSKAKDADIEELKNLLDEYLSEEEEEPEHAEEEPDPAELEALLEGKEEAEDCPDCGHAMDDCECPGEEEVESGEEELVGDEEEGESPDPDLDDDQEDVEDKKGKAKDRAQARDGVMATLRLLRPSIARSKDAAVHKAFNTALNSVKKTSRASNGGYGKFAQAARARDGAPRNPNPDRVRAADGTAPAVNKLQAFYDNALKGGK